MDRADWAPSPADIGAILRARTKDRNGNEIGTFDSSTRPTGDQVIDIIDTAVSEIAAEVGTVPDKVQDNARRVAALGAACLVELTFWPEQVATGRSPYAQIKEWYDKAFARLKIQVAEINGGGDVNNEDLLPVFSFPTADPNDPNAFPGWAARW